MKRPLIFLFSQKCNSFRTNFKLRWARNTGQRNSRWVLSTVSIFFFSFRSLRQSKTLRSIREKKKEVWNDTFYRSCFIEKSVSAVPYEFSTYFYAFLRYPWVRTVLVDERARKKKRGKGRFSDHPSTRPKGRRGLWMRALIYQHSISRATKRQ